MRMKDMAAPLLAVAALALAMPFAFAEDVRVRPSTCYLSAIGPVGQITCADQTGEAAPFEVVQVKVEGGAPNAIAGDLNLTFEGFNKAEDVYGYYLVTLDSDQLKITIVPQEELTTLASEVRRGGGYRGGGVHRGGAVHRGGYAYRGGGYAYRRGAAAVGVVGAGAAAARYYGSGCDPNYQDCGSSGGGYYPGGAVAVGARRGGAYYRGGAAYRRGGGAHVVHHRGGGRRR